MNNCPICGDETRALESRPNYKGDTIRRRKCLGCGRYFETKETLLREIKGRGGAGALKENITEAHT